MNRQQPPNNGNGKQTTERGVSDAIGFTLMFSIIIVGVGLISLAGGTQITDLSDAEELHSAERGMQSTAATLQPMATNGDLQRSFSLAFSNSNIWMNQSTLNITAADNSVNYPALDISSFEQRFDRSNGDITIRYEGGGVFRDNAIPAYDPMFTCREGPGGTNTAIVTVVNLTLAERDGLYISQGYNPNVRFNEFAGTDEAPVSNTDKTLNFDATLVSTEANRSESDTELYVNTSQTAGPDQWDIYFENKESWESKTNPEHVHKCDVDQTLIRVVTIEVEIIEPRFSN
ncbi:hypothetical protein ACFQJ7_15355 [Halovenus rubra]|uniref:Flagellin n=2 Tax=Halovenus rubra TaxID=869890 RepID=A0ABD5XC07_9EURY|nr:hypothetical protein [Halovenus rubra]